MKLDTSILLTACCGLTLSVTACEIRPVKASARPAVATPQPAKPQSPPPEEIASNLPVSVPQTQVTLPTPQPIDAAALATILPDSPPPPEAPNPTVRPPRTPARTEPRPAATVQLPPATVAPPPPTTPAPTRRLRPVESPAERQRLMTAINSRQRQVQDVLAKAKNRQLSEKDKSAVERIQSFLEQTETAVKEEDFQQADALSSRALLLTQDLSDK